MNTKMTNREALTIALSLFDAACHTAHLEDGVEAEERVAQLEVAKGKIENMISSLDKKAEAARARPRAVKVNPEREERIAKITAYLTENPEGKTCKEIAEAIGETSAKVSGALGVMRERGLAESHAGATRSAPSIHCLKVAEPAQYLNRGVAV